MRSVILSADDFGRSPERNRAIDTAFRQGLIRSAALIVNTRFTQDAVDKAIAGGYLKQLHCHFNISSDASVGGAALPLTDEMANDPLWCHNGKFRNGIRRSHEILLRHTDVMFRELEAQYLKFAELTHSEGNLSHIDFHLYHNLRWPVASALRTLVRKYDIRTARYTSVNMLYTSNPFRKVKHHVAHLLSRHPKVREYPSARINFFLHKPELMEAPVIELFCHPDYVGGELVDNTVPVFGNKTELLQRHVEMIREACDCEFVSWRDVGI